jgi:hypothetical protein
MQQPVRDDCPPEYRLARRSFLAGSVVFMGGLASSTHVAAAPLNASTALSAPNFEVKFMEVSSLLIDHKLVRQQNLWVVSGSGNLARA